MKAFTLLLLLGLPSLSMAGTWNMRLGSSGGKLQIIHSTQTEPSYIGMDQPATGAGEAFVSDLFNGANNLVITTNTHQMEIGGIWQEHSSYSSGNFIFTSSRTRSSDANTGCYYSTATPASANYTVQCVLFQQGSTIPGMGPAGRINTSANTMYFGRYSSSSAAWQLWKVVGAATTQLGSFSASTSNGASYTLQLYMFDSDIKLLLNGTEIISVTDTDISAAGKAGIRGSSQSGGQHIDSVVASNL